jgi:hypothetical protein
MTVMTVAISCAGLSMSKRQLSIAFLPQKKARGVQESLLRDLILAVREESIDDSSIADSSHDAFIVQLHLVNLAAALYETLVEVVWSDESTTHMFVGDMLDSNQLRGILLK